MLEGAGFSFVRIPAPPRPTPPRDVGFGSRGEPQTTLLCTGSVLAMSKVSARVRRRRFFAVVLVLSLFGGGALLLTNPEAANTVGNLFGIFGGSASANAEPRPDGLEHELGARFDRAQDQAAQQGIELYLNSGKRTLEEQDALFADAVIEYGSETEAERWVMRGEDSAHVTGDAIDVGPWEGMTWLAENYYEFGLCRVYQNEPWHFEVRGDVGEECPALLEDATQGR